MNRVQLRVSLLLCVCLVGFNARPCVAQETLDVMTFNIRYGSADDGANAWDLRKETVADAIRKYGPDIVGTQECLSFQAQYLDDALPGYEHFGMGRNADGSGERMEIFYRTDKLAPIETGHFWLSKTPDVPGSRDWNSANIRMVSWARFHRLESGDFFYYLNTHFDHRSEEARKQAAQLLAKHISGLPKSSIVVLTGDFNAGAERSEVWEILTKSGLSDSWLTAETTEGPEVTWSGFQDPTDSVNRIDWILHRGILSVSSCETILYNNNGRYPSDHYPVHARFVFGKND